MGWLSRPVPGVHQDVALWQQATWRHIYPWPTAGGQFSVRGLSYGRPLLHPGCMLRVTLQLQCCNRRFLCQSSLHVFTRTIPKTWFNQRYWEVLRCCRCPLRVWLSDPALGALCRRDNSRITHGMHAGQQACNLHWVPCLMYQPHSDDTTALADPRCISPRNGQHSSNFHACCLQRSQLCHITSAAHQASAQP